MKEVTTKPIGGRIGPAVRVLNRAWMQVGLTFLVLMTLNLVGYVLFPAPSKTDHRAFADAYHGATWTEEYFKEYRAHSTRWQPYSYWVGSEQNDKYIHVDANGFRRTWRSGPNQQSCEHPARIFMFGGSAMWGEGARDDETIASWLQRKLDERYLCATVTNMGQDGYVSTQEVLLAAEQVRRGNVPDLVIFYDGYNDVFAAEANETAGLTYNETQRRSEFNLSEASFHLYSRALTRFVLHRGIGRLATRLVIAFEPGRFEQVDGRLVRIGEAKQRALRVSKDARLQQAVADTFLLNKTFIDAIGERFGFRALFYWQPCILDKNRLTAYERREEAKDFLPGEPKFYRAISSRIVATAPKTGIRDLRKVFRDVQEPYFIDEVHVTGDANSMIADAILADIAAQLEQREARGAARPANGRGNNTQAKS